MSAPAQRLPIGVHGFSIAGRRLGPAHVWADPQMRRALATRDIAAVFRILQSAGVSQRRIAAATGQSQSEISEILKRGRRVRAIDVLERIADGLGVPRVWLGLGHDEEGARLAGRRAEVIDCSAGPINQSGRGDVIEAARTLLGAALAMLAALGNRPTNGDPSLTTAGVQPSADCPQWCRGDTLPADPQGFVLHRCEVAVHEVPSLSVGQTDRIRILLERFDAPPGVTPQPACIVWDDGADGHEFTAAQARALAASLCDAALRLELSHRL